MLIAQIEYFVEYIINFHLMNSLYKEYRGATEVSSAFMNVETGDEFRLRIWNQTLILNSAISSIEYGL